MKNLFSFLRFRRAWNNFGSHPDNSTVSYIYGMMMMT